MVLFRVSLNKSCKNSRIVGDLEHHAMWCHCIFPGGSSVNLNNIRYNEIDGRECQGDHAGFLATMVSGGYTE